MNTISAHHSFIPSYEENQNQEPYFDWVTANYPLLSGHNLEQEYSKRMLKQIVSTQTAAVSAQMDSRIVIRVDEKNEIYTSLKKAAWAQFSMLCNSARMAEGMQAREYLCYLVLSNGYPAYAQMQERIADDGAIVLSRLMEKEAYRAELYSTVTGIIGYSQNARTNIRILMLEAFALYFYSPSESGPSRRELSTVLFDALNLELRRPRANQSIEFQDRLINLLSRHPHPATKTLLTVLANEHYDEQVREYAAQALRKLEVTLMGVWEATTADLVSSEEFRAVSLAEVNELDISLPDRIHVIFNACKGLPITDLKDKRLAELNKLMSDDSELISLVSAIALSQIYQIALPCEIAGKAISILTDRAINAQGGRFVLDALSALRAFELLSEASQKRVNNAFCAANLKFVIRSEN